MRQLTARISALLIPLALMMIGCPGEPSVSCQPACAQGFACDEARGICAATAIPRYEAVTPGRAARVAWWLRGPLIAALAPSEGALVVSDASVNPPEVRLLARDVAPQSARLGLAVSPVSAAVMWRRASGYALARRDAQDDHASWQVEPLTLSVSEGGAPTLATDDFDLALGELGAAQLVWRDERTQALYYATRAREDAPWRVELVDDGRTRLAPEPCPESARSRGRGVGREPDLLVTAGEVMVAYHDADCGTLRLARRGAVQWTVSVVDAGEGPRPITGRWPSVAMAPSGLIGIAYQDMTQGRLMFAASRGEGFEREVVDDAPMLDIATRRVRRITGAFATLSFDSQSRPLITYLDATQLSAMWARGEAQAPRAWSTRVVLEEGAVGLFTHHTRTPGDGVWVVAERQAPGEAGQALTSSLAQTQQVRP